MLDPAPLNELYPRPDGDPELDLAWVTRGAPVTTKLSKARLRLLTRKRHWTLPATRHLRQKSNHLVSHRCAILAPDRPALDCITNCLQKCMALTSGRQHVVMSNLRALRNL